MAIVLRTYGEQLAEIDKAITAVMSGQRYELGGRSMWKPDLAELRRERAYLTDKLQAFGDIIPTQSAQTGRAYGVSFG